MKNFLEQLDEISGSVKWLALAFAMFAFIYSAVNARDIFVFYADYFAGVAGGIAMFMWFDDEEGD